MTHSVQRVAIAPSQRVNEQIMLTLEQQHYLYRVLRLRAGDRFIAVDGQSGWWLTELSQEAGTAICLECLSVQNELSVAVTLLMAMPKSGMDDVVRQATELGVSAILPVQSDRTVLKPSPQKVDRWRRIAQEAVEQSERQVIPTVYAPQSWSDAIAQVSASTDLRLMCRARGSAQPLLHLLTSTPAQSIRSIALAIGPEGGWTAAEAEQAIAAGFCPVQLGDRILRAVTAPIAALAIIAAVFEDPAYSKPETLS